MEDVNVIGSLEVTYKHPTQGLTVKKLTASLYTKINSTHWTIITCASSFTRFGGGREFDAYSAKFFLQKGNPKGGQNGGECLAEFKVVQFDCYEKY